MKSKPVPPNHELDALLKRSAEITAAMTPAQRAEMALRQSVSYVRGEMGIEHPDWSEERLNEVTRHMPQAWALAEIDRLRSALKGIFWCEDHGDGLYDRDNEGGPSASVQLEVALERARAALQPVT